MKEYTTIRITKELKAQINTLEGTTIEDKLNKVLNPARFLTEGQRAEVLKLINERIEAEKGY